VDVPFGAPVSKSVLASSGLDVADIAKAAPARTHFIARRIDALPLIRSWVYRLLTISSTGGN
jgi:hypothetical protein